MEIKGNRAADIEEIGELRDCWVPRVSIETGRIIQTLGIGIEENVGVPIYFTLTEMDVWK